VGLYYDRPTHLARVRTGERRYTTECGRTVSCWAVVDFGETLAHARQACPACVAKRGLDAVQPHLENPLARKA